MEKIIRKVKYSEAEENDLLYWLSKSPQQKIEALTRIRMNYHQGQRLVKEIQKVRRDF